jgi:hypothetical protein
MIAECYHMTLQCDFSAATHHYLCRRDEFTGKSSADVWRQAKAAGWRLYPQSRKAKCPKCFAAEVAKRMP